MKKMIHQEHYGSHQYNEQPSPSAIVFSPDGKAIVGDKITQKPDGSMKVEGSGTIPEQVIAGVWNAGRAILKPR